MLCTLEHSNTEGSEREFTNAGAAALSPNVNTPPYDSLKLMCVENELGQPRSAVGGGSGISWFFVHCVLCPKLLVTMHFRMMRNGGLFFLIPLTISTCFIAAPLAFMELALGQYTSKQAAHIFARISPISAEIFMLFLILILFETGFRLLQNVLQVLFNILGAHWKVIGSMPGGHRVDGILAFFMVCLVCSKIGVSKFSKASPVIVMFSFIAIMLTIFSLLPTGYYTVFPKFFTVLDNDPSYLFSLDTWAEAVIVVIR
uniref:Aa_trans domain-containing protein n=1 Tax=Angiostrongylus cantonensis TaxID=6313 RepID=A0A0K0CWH8_ANGCA